jgi:hypothetical protein
MQIAKEGKRFGEVLGRERESREQSVPQMCLAAKLWGKLHSLGIAEIGKQKDSN